MSGCHVCLKSKAPYICGACQSVLCKEHAHFNEIEAFLLPEKPPEELSHDVYCSVCYDRIVFPVVQQNREIMRKAKNVNVFFKDQGKETRLVKKSEKPVKVEKCKDRDEAILKLAFLAAQAGFDTLVSVEIISEKIRNGGYQSTIYKGSGIPANTERK
jgi:hypothetical protein